MKLSEIKAGEMYFINSPAARWNSDARQGYCLEAKVVEEARDPNDRWRWSTKTRKGIPFAVRTLNHYAEDKPYECESFNWVPLYVQANCVELGWAEHLVQRAARQRLTEELNAVAEAEQAQRAKEFDEIVKPVLDRAGVELYDHDRNEYIRYPGRDLIKGSDLVKICRLFQEKA